ncbi:MAG TPA: hypothetical protein VF637_06855 [Sphingomicrobium sp.]
MRPQRLWPTGAAAAEGLDGVLLPARVGALHLLDRVELTHVVVTC